MRFFLPKALWLAAPVAAMCLLACGTNIQPEYSLELRLPQGQNPWPLATSVTLEAVGTGVRITQQVANGQPPQLKLRGLNPRTNQQTTFVVTINGPAGPLAYGQSPPILLSPDENFVRLAIAVQQFQSLAQPVYQQTVPRLADSNVVTAFAVEENAPPVATPVFFGGRSLDTTGAERSTRAGFLYNPFLHTLVDTNFFPTTTTGIATWARSDGTLWLFGGRIPKAAADANLPETPQDFSGTAERLGVGQYLSALRVDLIGTYPTTMPAFFRAHAAITEVGSPAAPRLFVFGGEVVQGEPAALSALTSVVSIDLTPQAPATSVVQMAPFQMLSPRTRHTATALNVVEPVTGVARQEVLLFGGSPNDSPVAELFDVASNTFVPLGPEAGAPRFGHKAIPLRDGRLLILCGTDSTGVPPADARIYDPNTRAFTVAPLPLVTPRAEAACFAVGNDLVIAGGRDAAGTLVGTAEVFDLSTLQPLATLAAVARSGARDAALPDGTVLLAGGRELLTGQLVPSNLLEFYRPRLGP